MRAVGPDRVTEAGRTEGRCGRAGGSDRVCTGGPQKGGPDRVTERSAGGPWPEGGRAVRTGSSGPVQKQRLKGGRTVRTGSPCSVKDRADGVAAQSGRGTAGPAFHGTPCHDFRRGLTARARVRRPQSPRHSPS